MPVNSVWHGKRVVEGMKRELAERLRLSALLIKEQVRHIIRKQGRTESGYVKGSGKRARDSITGASARRIGTFRSQPGEPPRKQTGRLRRSIRTGVQKQKLEAFCGTDVPYAKDLEFGRGTVPKMAPRPFLKRSLYHSTEAIRAIFAREMKGYGASISTDGFEE